MNNENGKRHTSMSARNLPHDFTRHKPRDNTSPTRWWVNESCIWNQDPMILSRPDCAYLDCLKTIIKFLYSSSLTVFLDGVLLSLNLIVFMWLLTTILLNELPRLQQRSRAAIFNPINTTIFGLWLFASSWMVTQILDPIIDILASDWIILHCFSLSYIWFSWFRYKNVIKLHVSHDFYYFIYFSTFVYIILITLSIASCWDTIQISNVAFFTINVLGFLTLLVLDFSGIYAFRQQLRGQRETYLDSCAAQDTRTRLNVIASYGVYTCWLQVAMALVIMVENFDNMYRNLGYPASLFLYQLLTVKKCAWVAKHVLLFLIPIPLVAMKWRLAKVNRKSRQQSETGTADKSG
ncbi:hypothetical protein BC830DRAFT_1123676 [Chytriomyces sp. MP71]|nr:hypothetical protein BC830DRAFT_1123676 [Chytriomyces sp. MP71]